jgi:2-dehydropantoate 2-reductase
MPCTILPSWWLNKYSRKNIKQIIPIKKIIGMTMWVSGIMQNNNVVIKHTQRGYPLKEISNKNKSNADILRKMIRKKSKSPLVKNIYSEIYLKVINSFAFNLIAIKYNQSNNMLIKNQNAINEIKLIMYEFDKLVSYMGLPILQSVNSRVNQTLSSKKHTMSMLTDLRNGKKIEIKNQWLSLMQIDKAIKTNVALSENFYKSTIKLIGK